MANDKSSLNGPLVSVVVVTMNAGDLLRQCLAGLAAQDYQNVEVIVVDNGSTGDVARLLHEEFRGFKHVGFDKNMGFASGTNRGIEHAAGDYVALLNDDAATSPDWISSMLSVAESDPTIGAVGSVVIDGNNPSVLDSFGVGIALDGMSRQSLAGRPIPALSAPQDVLAVSGCACMFRMRALVQTGLFDERFFAYCEDTDLCLRLQRAGWRIVVAPLSRVTHYYSRTAGSFSLRKIFWLERNHFWVAIKNFPLILTPLVPLVSVWRIVVLAYVALHRIGPARTVVCSRGPAALAATLLSAQIAAALGMPLMILSRIISRPQKKRSDLEICRLLFRHRMSVYEIITGGGT